VNTQHVVAYVVGADDWLVAETRRAATGRGYRFLTEKSSAEEMSDALGAARALVAEPANALALRQACPDLRFIQFSTCDYPQSVLAELQSKGLQVASLGAALAEDVAKTAIGLMIAVAECRKGLALGDPTAQAGQTSALNGKTVGIVGLGRVGTAIAGLLERFNARVLYSDVRTAPQQLRHALPLRRVTQDRLLVESDFVTLNVPLTDQSRGLLGRRDIGLIGPETVLVNTSAPEIVNRQSLVDALEGGYIKGYGAIDLDPGLAAHNNVVQLGPQAVRTTASAVRVARWIVDNADAAVAGRPVRGLVETIGFPKAGDPAFWSSRMTPREELT